MVMVVPQNNPTGLIPIAANPRIPVQPVRRRAAHERQMRKSLDLFIVTPPPESLIPYIETTITHNNITIKLNCQYPDQAGVQLVKMVIL